MKKLLGSDFRNLSFPDSSVLGIEYSRNLKHMVVHLDSAWLDVEGGLGIGKSFLNICYWKSANFRLYESDSDEWRCIEDPLIEPLEDICESSFNDESACIAGFSSESGKWVEWRFHGPNVIYELNL